eukprot:scaffold76633_cov30-Prasinocladus_malaysianus.AAC.1
MNSSVSSMTAVVISLVCLTHQSKLTYYLTIKPIFSAIGVMHMIATQSSDDAKMRGVWAVCLPKMSTRNHRGWCVLKVIGAIRNS